MIFSGIKVHGSGYIGHFEHLKKQNVSEHHLPLSCIAFLTSAPIVRGAEVGSKAGSYPLRVAPTELLILMISLFYKAFAPTEFLNSPLGHFTFTPSHLLTITSVFQH